MHVQKTNPRAASDCSQACENCFGNRLSSVKEEVFYQHFPQLHLVLLVRQRTPENRGSPSASASPHLYQVPVTKHVAVLVPVPHIKVPKPYYNRVPSAPSGHRSRYPEDVSSSISFIIM